MRSVISEQSGSVGAVCKCGKKFQVPLARIRDNRGKYCSNKCKYKYYVRPKGLHYNIKVRNKAWFKFTGGAIDKKGYRILYKSGKHVREHRFLMEEHLNKKLDKLADVHHVNGNKLDNRIENLIILSHSEHTRYHNLQR